MLLTPRGLGAGAVAAAGRPGGAAPRDRGAGRQRRRGQRVARPPPPGARQPPVERFRAGLGMLRANVSLESPAGRHALRLTVVVLLAELISRHLPLSRSYWMVVAAATTLRPEFGATFTRGAERLGGTALGVGLAGAIAVALHPAGSVTVADRRRSWRGRGTRCSRPASRSVSRSSPRSSCSC